MSLEDQPFFVLTLQPEQGRYVGTVSHPRRMTTDGTRVSGISRDVTTERVTTDAPRGSTLRIVAAPAAGSTDTTEFEFTLTTVGESTHSGPTQQLRPFGTWIVVAEL